MPARGGGRDGDRRATAGRGWVQPRDMKKPAARCVAGPCRAGGCGFLGGDGACVHRKKFPGGGLSCLARFRLGPAHSLLWPPLLGRNLITLFSTVNTPAAFFRVPMAAAIGGRVRAGRRGAATDARAARCRRENAFAKTLVLRALRYDGATCALSAPRRCSIAGDRRDGADRPFAAPMTSSGNAPRFGVAQPEMRESAQEIPSRVGAVDGAGCAFVCVDDPNRSGGCSRRQRSSSSISSA